MIFALWELFHHRLEAQVVLNVLQVNTQILLEVRLVPTVRQGLLQLLGASALIIVLCVPWELFQHQLGARVVLNVPQVNTQILLEVRLAPTVRQGLLLLQVELVVIFARLELFHWQEAQVVVHVLLELFPIIMEAKHAQTAQLELFLWLTVPIVLLVWLEPFPIKLEAPAVRIAPLEPFLWLEVQFAVFAQWEHFHR